MKSYLTLLLALFCTATLCAQTNNDILFTFGEYKVTKAEFLRGYEKNSNTKQPVYTQKELRDYLNLYINYKLKVKAAEDTKIDTFPNVKKELFDYKKQLAQSFLTEKNISDKLITQTYERMTKEVNASHILVKLNDNPTPLDTTAAYNKILELRRKVTSGENFETLAFTSSDDPSAKQNKGNLGYFTALQMVYPFETAAYNTPIKTVSQPIRTKFGYHLVYTNDIRPARGEILVQNILLKLPEKATPQTIEKVKAKADSLYLVAKKGSNFDELAKKYSEDKFTATTGGKLPWFGTGKMVEAFENSAFSLLNNGDISEPIRTNIGYYILRRLDQKGIAPLAEMKDGLKKKIEKDSRSEISKLAYIEKIKKENSFILLQSAYNEVLDKTSLDLAKPTWKADSVLTALSQPLFSLGGKSFNQQDFVRYIIQNKSKQKPQEKTKMIATLLEAMITQTALEIEENNLEQKNPEFKIQLKEYRDGILLFDLMERKVWNAAIHDTTGLKVFYETNKSNYKRKESVHVVTFKCPNDSAAIRVSAAIKIFTLATKNDFLAQINKIAKGVTLEENYYEKGQNLKVDDMAWQAGTQKNVVNASGAVDLYYIVENTTGKLKTLNDSKGFIVADYQEYLEKDWLNELKKQTPVSINETVFSSIIRN